MENTAEKLSLFNDLKDKSQIYKVLPTIINTPYDILKQNIGSLSMIGITINHIFQIKICAIDPEQLKNNILYIKNNDLAEKYVKDPLLLLDFEEDKSIGNSDNEETEYLYDIDIFAKPNKVNDNIEKKVNTFEHKELSIDDIVNDQFISLNSHNFDRYQILSEVLNRVIEHVGSENVKKNSEIYDLLSKLVASDKYSDFDCLYLSITTNNNYDYLLEEEIKSCINNELSLLTKLDNNEVGE